MAEGVQPKVFLSYRRRTGSDRAERIRQHLVDNGCRVFFDHVSLGAGHFDEQIMENIQNCTHFILILFPTDLDRCIEDEQDWIHREAAAALRNTGCKIIPVVSLDFEWPDTSVLPEGMRDLSRNNQVRWMPEYIDATLKRIIRFVFPIAERADLPESEPDSARVTVTDFQLTQLHVSRICEIVENTPNLVNTWRIVITGLFEPRDRNDIQNRINPFFAWIFATIEHWISVQGERATFNSLIAVFRSRRLNNTADALEAIRVELRNMA